MHPILYAEDEENDVYFLSRAFEMVGIVNPLQAVANGQLAIDYLSGAGPYADRDQYPLPCLVLLDLKMPLKTGLEVLAWIRANPNFAPLPVIMLSSSTADADIQHAYSQGVNGYLAKPGKPGELQALVKSLKEFWLVHNRTVHELEDRC